MAYGSMAPGMPQMPIPNFMGQDPSQQGMAILQAALKAKQGATGAPGSPPALLGANGGIANMMGGGMGNGLLAKLFPQAPPPPAGAPTSLAPPAPGASAAPPPGPIDPNTGLPVTPDVMAGAASMGGAGPAPTALTGLW